MKNSNQAKPNTNHSQTKSTKNNNNNNNNEIPTLISSIPEMTPIF